MPSVPKAPVSDEAADTVIDPVSFGAVVVEVVDVPAEELPQAAMAACRERQRQGADRPRIHSSRSGSYRLYLHHHAGGLDDRGGQITLLEPEVVGGLAGEQ